NPGTAVYRVVDLNTLKVEVGIPQALISRVGMGSRVRVTISALQNRMFPGKVEYVSPQADETTGAFTAEIHIKNNKDLEIRAGMTARLALQLEEKDGQLVVPDYAIVKKNGDNYVYLVKENVARLAMVDIAETIGSNAIVSDGLAEGDKVVVVGMKNLGIETRVSIETEN
ncbi:MAG: efflux RND transporter periplasmic adaptor subunit, partial [Calditrichaeota bacterium]